MLIVMQQFLVRLLNAGGPLQFYVLFYVTLNGKMMVLSGPFPLASLIKCPKFPQTITFEDTSFKLDKYTKYV